MWSRWFKSSRGLVRIELIVDTAEAEDGFDEVNMPSYVDQLFDIKELLRSGYVEVINSRKIND
jgi:hypothetical protein